ncbi:hypothetical protein BC833DRAFT_614098 [Globomyces pollinis-pini]|nr:hypothetical protein BC833DRAFT_614098 [Globomyces pollinis-pini]
MSDNDNQYKWNKFVEIGNTIHKMRGQFQLFNIRNSLKDQFISNFPIKDQQLYDILLPKIACYLDGNAEIIQDAVEKYFLAQHCKASLDENLFQVDGDQTTRYFIKIHQYGPTEDNWKSLQPPDTKELFIYKFLSYLGIGPDVHFIPSRSSKMTIYISTKDFNDNPMIVDFRIKKQIGIYFKSDILDKFYQGNGEFNYSGLMVEAVRIPQDQKLLILRNSLQEDNQNPVAN